MNSFPAGAIIMGGHFHSLGAVRSLGRKGVQVVLLDYENNISRFSKYISRFHKCPEYHFEEPLLRTIIRLVLKYNYNGWVIFPSDDESVYFLSKYHKILSRYLKVSIPPWNISQHVYNKKNTYQKAESLAIPIPRTYYPACPENLDDIDIKFPAVIKPAVMRSFFKITHKKVFRVTDGTALRKYYEEACQCICQEEILLQEEIPSAADHLYSFCPFFKDSRPVSYIIAKRHRQHPLDYGQASTYAETVDCPELVELGTQFLSSIDFYGICEVEFVFDQRDKTFKLLEVNPRIWGWHTLSEASGVDLLYQFFLDMIGMRTTQQVYRKGVHWIRLLTDVPTAIIALFKRRLPLKTYLNQIFGPKEYAVLSWDDPIPFLMDLTLAPYYWAKRGF